MFWQDMRYAFRTLRKSPAYAAMAIATIALAIGANTAMFSFVNGVLLRPLPYPDADRVVQVLEKRPDGGRNGVSTLNYLDWVEQSTVFEYLAAGTGWNTTLTGVEEPVQLTGQRVSSSFFEITGARFALGRDFLVDEDERGSDRVVILSYALWQSRFGGDAAIVGREILLDGQSHTVVGVLAESRTYDRSWASFWKPLAFQPENMTRDFHWFFTRGKLKPGVSLAQAQAEMDVIGARIAEEHPDSNKGWGVAVDPLGEMLVSPETRSAVIALFAATAAILLIGCANLANLALARGLARSREIAVRASLGAGRWRLARQILTENLALAVAGGTLGIGIGYGVMRWVSALLPERTLPAEVDVRLDPTVLAFAAAAVVVTGILCGLAAALRATRANLMEPIKEGAAGAPPASGGGRIRSTLVVAEVALAFVLLVGAGLLLRSLLGLLTVDPGFDSTNVLTAGLPVSTTQHPEPADLNRYLEQIREAVAAVPGVRETALASVVPMRGWGYGMPYLVADGETIDRASRNGGFFKMVSPGYFETLRIAVIDGRPLRDTDTEGAPPVIVINETLAKKEFPDRSPIGRRLLVQQIVPGQTQLGDDVAWEIVGVIRDEKVGSLGDEAAPGMYVTMRQSPVYFGSIVVRAAVEPRSLERSVRAAIAGVNKDQALNDVLTLEQITDQSLGANRLQTLLLGIFAAFAVLLAAIGIYGVIAYSVTQRTHELGIRAALGASAGTLRGLVFMSGMRLTLIGLALGFVGSLVLTSAVASLIYGVDQRDPWTILAVAALLAAVSAAACFVPARRATRLDPLTALRSQ
jgi:putative ABC transport system permease protein